MNIKELRIGNIIGNANSFPMTVVLLGDDYAHLDFEGNEGDIWEEDEIFLNPIKLTKEILLHSGFKEESKNRFTDDIIEIICCEKEWRIYVNDYYLKSFNYVHELQNIYFIMFNKEINIQVWF